MREVVEPKTSKRVIVRNFKYNIARHRTKENDNPFVGGNEGKEAEESKESEADREDGKSQVRVDEDQVVD